MTARLLPDLSDPLTAPFWAAAAQSRLVAPRCASCRTFRWPPSARCPACGESEAPWEELAGTATVWSYAVYHRAMHPAFADAVPYTVALLELPEGIRMYGTIVTSTGDADADAEICVGSRVHAAYERVSDDAVLVRWIPAEVPTP